jgi:hypothetical protein
VQERLEPEHLRILDVVGRVEWQSHHQTAINQCRCLWVRLRTYKNNKKNLPKTAPPTIKNKRICERFVYCDILHRTWPLGRVGVHSRRLNRSSGYKIDRNIKASYTSNEFSENSCANSGREELNRRMAISLFPFSIRKLATL